MWVIYNDEVFPNRPGILTYLSPEDVATVMLVQEDGTNLLEVKAFAGALRQATRDEIPAARRPDRKLASSLGYE